MSVNEKFYKKVPMTTEGNKLAAWADIEKTEPESRVPIPSELCVEEAKHWVDNVQK
ncbi:CDIF630_02480 family spore surface protein [Abyssisolibacter fermentans]|uniref:CDIF630_02480 family spore surface protein n=1 Tax=Abyssisolibacter fermentans TaxID=1766203 RepID=UPI0009EC955E